VLLEQSAVLLGADPEAIAATSWPGRLPRRPVRASRGLYWSSRL